MFEMKPEKGERLKHNGGSVELTAFHVSGSAKRDTSTFNDKRWSLCENF